MQENIYNVATLHNLKSNVISNHYKKIRSTEEYDFELSNTLRQHLNLSFIYVHPKDMEYGRKLQSGSWTGVIGLVHRNECVIGLHTMSANRERLQVVDFSTPYLFDAISFFLRKPQTSEVQKSSFFLKPFTTVVWLNILVVFLILNLKITQRHFIKLKGTIRIRRLAYLCLFQLLQIAYSSNLTSATSFESTEPLIYTIEEMKEAFKDHRYFPSGLAGSDTAKMLQTSPTLPKYIPKMFVAMHRKDNILRRIITENLAYLGMTKREKFAILKMKLHKEIYNVEEIFISKITVLILQKNSGFRKYINNCISRLRDFGILEKWDGDMMDEYESAKRSFAQRHSNNFIVFQSLHLLLIIFFSVNAIFIIINTLSSILKIVASNRTLTRRRRL